MRDEENARGAPLRLSGSHAGQLFSSGSFGTCHPLLCIGFFTLYDCSFILAMFAATSSKRGAWYGPQRNKRLGPSSAGAGPEWLTVEHPRGYGWDTASLAADPVTFVRYCEAELMHARWAMLGTLKCLTPELLGKAGFPITEPVWVKAGAQWQSLRVAWTTWATPAWFTPSRFLPFGGARLR